MNQKSKPSIPILIPRIPTVAAGKKSTVIHKQKEMKRQRLKKKTKL